MMFVLMDMLLLLATLRSSTLLYPSLCWNDDQHKETINVYKYDLDGQLTNYEKQDDGNTRADKCAPDGDEDPAARGYFDQGRPPLS